MIPQIICFNPAGNNGRPDCAYYPSPDYMLLDVPYDQQFVAADFVDFGATIKALLQNTDVLKRGYLWGTFNGFTPTDQDRATFTADDGSIYTTREIIRSLEYMIAQSDTCMQKAMVIALDGSQNRRKYYRIQKKGFMMAQVVIPVNDPLAGTGLYEPVLTGYTAQDVYVPARGEAGYTTTAASRVIFNFIDPKGDQMREAPVDTTNINWLDMMRQYSINSVKVNVTTLPTVAGQYKFVLNAGCGGAPLSKIFATTGAQLTATYRVVNTLTGAVLPISSIAVAANGEVTLALVTPLATGTLVTIGLADLVSFPTGGVKKYETPASSQDSSLVGSLDKYKLTIASA